MYLRPKPAYRSSPGRGAELSTSSLRAPPPSFIGQDQRAKAVVSPVVRRGAECTVRVMLRDCARVDTAFLVGLPAISDASSSEKAAREVSIATPALLDAERMVEVRHPSIVNLAWYWREDYERAVKVAYLREGAFKRLVEAAESLPEGYTLAVFDAWRPLGLQYELYEEAYRDRTLPPGYVAVPSADPANPPPHLTGGVVDVTLAYENEALALGSGFDEFVPKASLRAYEAKAGPIRDLRRLLFWTMRDAGFVAIESEWWHYEYGTRAWAGATGGAPLYGAAEVTGG